jgi:hypothetical protein
MLMGMQRTSWIYGPSDAKIMLSVFESGYFMRDLDPAGGFQQAQKYYTNQNSDFNSVKVGSRLNNSSDASQNDSLSLAQLNTNLTTDGKDVITVSLQCVWI